MKNGNSIGFDRISDLSKSASKTDAPLPANSTALSATGSTSPLQTIAPVSSPMSPGLIPEAHGGTLTKSSSVSIPAKLKIPFASSNPSSSIAKMEQGDVQRKDGVLASSAAADGVREKNQKNKSVAKSAGHMDKEICKKSTSTASMGVPETETKAKTNASSPSTSANVRNLLLCRHLPQAVRISSLGLRVCGAVPIKTTP